MRERERLFKSYSEETNPTVKLTKYSDYKRIVNIVVPKRKKKEKNSIIKIISKEIQKISKKIWDGIKPVVTLKSKTKLSPNPCL